MLRRKFAVIKLWPALQTAEDECIARLKITAKALGLECVEVDSFARLLDPPHAQLTQDDVDFVLSLHFETPKRYDIFSFVALWNPLQFFHEWGYRKFTANLGTHDDFLSCSSPWADDHVRRLVANDPMREPPELRLYHSLSDPILPPTTGDGKLFYAGINWEKLGNKPQRHGALLKLLDQSGGLRIYGPKLFNGVDVWAGYASYSGQIPFDGVSMIRLIHKAGVSLVLSSEAHRQSELMSSRLFESLAAGAVIICDENPFARRFFGDTLLYIDTSLGAEATYQQVQNHLEWVGREPEAARELAKRAQEIFLRDFSLDQCLEKIYSALPARREKLEALYSPQRTQEPISLILLMPEFKPELLERHITSVQVQKNVGIRPILAMDRRDYELFGERIKARLEALHVPLEIQTLDFFDRYPSGKTKSRRALGPVLYQAIEELVQGEYFCIVGPHERLFSDHLCSLLRTLEDNETAGCAWAGMLLAHKTEGQDFADLNGEPGTHFGLTNKPIGYGRFLFRKSRLKAGFGTALPYLDALSMDLLFGITKSVPSRRCTLVMDIQDRFNLQLANSTRPDQEREVIMDFAPALFRQPGNASDGAVGVPPAMDSLTKEQRVKFMVDLAHDFPFPAFLKNFGFRIYRAWLRRQSPGA